MARRFGLPIVVLLVAAVFWWLDRTNERDEPRPKPASTAPISAEEFVGDVSVESWQQVDDFKRELVLFESVFWEPADTISLRKLIRETSLAKGKTVFEIGCLRSRIS